MLKLRRASLGHPCLFSRETSYSHGKYLFPVTLAPGWHVIPFFGLKLKDLALKTRKSLFSAAAGIPDAAAGAVTGSTDSDLQLRLSLFI